MKKTLTFYHSLVYLAYIYFIVVGGIWFYESYTSNKSINYSALVVILIFVVQACIRHKLTNLIIGIICLFMSIITFLDIASLFGSFKNGEPVTNDVKLLMAFGILNIIMSGILIFSYLMFNREDPI